MPAPPCIYNIANYLYIDFIYHTCGESLLNSVANHY